MTEKIPAALNLALAYLRAASGWSKARLARALGFADRALLNKYENGAKALTREQLERLLKPLNVDPEAVDVLLFAHGLLAPEPPGEGEASPVPLLPEERRLFHRASMAAGWAAAELVRTEAVRARKQEKIEAARRQAEETFQYLMTLTPEERGGLVEVFPDYWRWALALRFCEGSIRKAAHRAQEALELADLALAIAERVEGSPAWVSRLTGWCHAHVANARRVANDHAGADAAFAKAWDLWRAGADSEGLLPEWRLLDLEASLRRAERRFPEALELLDRARAGCSEEPGAVGRILLNKEHALEQMGDPGGALEVLAEAAPFIEMSGDQRSLFAFQFKLANNLCHLERFAEAAARMPQVRELAEPAANQLDLLRVTWLAARVDAGQGRPAEAVAGLELVFRELLAHELPYDAALSSLDLAMLWLGSGRTAEVRKLTLLMARIFKMKGIDREALAALALFCDAARRETATVELAKQVRSEIEVQKRSASSSFTARRDRG